MKRKKNRISSFVAFPWQLLNSNAYLALKPSSAKALPYFLGKIKVAFGDPARYETEFAFGYGEALRLGFSAATFHGIICDLIEKGFIDGISKGGLRGAGGTYSLFKLSERWRDYGEPGFELLKWQCVEPRYLSRRERKRKAGD
jgi:hypothetical protein